MINFLTLQRLNQQFQDEVNGYTQLMQEGVYEVEPLLVESMMNLSKVNSLMGASTKSKHTLGQSTYDAPSFYPAELTVKDIACHTFALSGDPSIGREVNKEFERLTMIQGYKYNFGEGLSRSQLKKARIETMDIIRSIRDMQVDADGPKVELYVCGGFRNGQVAPEHLWLEDNTNNITFDTMPNIDIKVVKGVGKPGKPFRSGCEAYPFMADEIVRIPVPGYTAAQIKILKDKGLYALIADNKENNKINTKLI